MGGWEASAVGWRVGGGGGVEERAKPFWSDILWDNKLSL